MPSEQDGTNPPLLSRCLVFGGGVCLLSACLSGAASGRSGLLVLLLGVGGVLMIGGAKIIRRWQAWPVRLVVLAVCLAPLVLVVVFALVFGNAMRDATATVTDPNQYSEKLNKYWRTSYPELVEHFPPSIPLEARNVRFSFTPHFLQGGALLQLRYATTDENLSALQREYSAKRTPNYDRRGRAVDVSDKNQIPLPVFTTGVGEERFREIPEDFDLMFFDEFISESEMAKSEFFWNHGHTHGLAISEKRREVIYWAEAW